MIEPWPLTRSIDTYNATTLYHPTVDTASDGRYILTYRIAQVTLVFSPRSRGVSLVPLFYSQVWTSKQHPINRTLSAYNMLKSIWRHSGNNSMCPCLCQVSLSFFVDGVQILLKYDKLFNCQRIGLLGAPSGYTHGWGRRNGPLGSLGSIRFSRSLL
jgi:hypothetical protein